MWWWWRKHLLSNEKQISGCSEHEYWRAAVQLLSRDFYRRAWGLQVFVCVRERWFAFSFLSVACMFWPCARNPGCLVTWGCGRRRVTDVFMFYRAITTEPQLCAPLPLLCSGCAQLKKVSQKRERKWNQETNDTSDGLINIMPQTNFTSIYRKKSYQRMLNVRWLSMHVGECRHKNLTLEAGFQNNFWPGEKKKALKKSIESSDRIY